MVRKGALALTTLFTCMATLSATPAHAAAATETQSPPAAVVLRAEPAEGPRPAVRLTAVTESLATPTYRVVAGDTLSAIAARFCGSSAAYPALAAASGVANADRIWPGDRILLVCTGKPAAPRPAVAAVAPAPAPVATSSSAADRAVAFALRQVGKWYAWGTAGPNTYDCSGLAMAAYASVGIRLPHNAAEQSHYGRYVSRSDLRPGDLVFPYSSLGHVVIYIGNGQIVEAPHSGAKVSVRALYGFYTARRYV